SDLALYSADRRLMAAAGAPLPTPLPEWAHSRWLPSPIHGLAAALHLRDGRWLILRRRYLPRPMAEIHGLLMFLVAAAIGTHLVSRRIPRRLERLKSRVESLGGGDLSARVDVEGRDEVADLARSFNRAAERIERLVQAQRTVLAGASHELRSPLARIRMATELL